MSETPDQVQMRQHLAELRHAAGGLGRDMALEFEHVDEKINRLGRLTARDARHAAEDIRDDFTDMARASTRRPTGFPTRSGRPRAGPARRSGTPPPGSPPLRVPRSSRLARRPEKGPGTPSPTPPGSDALR
jgi:hypothetical protein